MSKPTGIAKLYVRRFGRFHSPFLRNLVGTVKSRDKYRENKATNSNLNATSFISPFAITNPLQTISAGLFLQPSDDAPSGWLALSAFIGLPLALWAYKVRPLAQLVGYES